MLFVETFEAWFAQRMKQVIIDFSSSKCREIFLTHMENNPQWFRLHFHGVPKLEGSVSGPGSTKSFFDHVTTLSGVDLLKTHGKPPAR